MGPPQGRWNPITTASNQTVLVPKVITTTGPTGWPQPQWPSMVDPWHDQRDGAVGRCRVDLPVDAPLPDDLEWTVVDRTRDRDRWVDVVVIEGDNLPRHMAGEMMTTWRSFKELRDTIARAITEAILGPQQAALQFGGQAIYTNPSIFAGTPTGTTTGGLGQWGLSGLGSLTTTTTP
mgnify:FL=1